MKLETEGFPWGLASVPVSGRLVGERSPWPSWGGKNPFPSLTGQRKHFFLFSALQEIVLGMRGAERKGQTFYFVFQIEILLLAVSDTQVCSQAHSLLCSVGEILGHGERLDRKEHGSTTL